MAELLDIQIIDRAQRAQDILNNELFNEAFDNLKQQYVGALLSCPASNVEGVRNLHLAACILGSVKEHLRAMIADGEVVKFGLQEDKNT